MAFKYICDGCGKDRDTMEELEARGHVIKGIYCQSCLPLVDAYLKDVDKLQEDVAKDFNSALYILRDEHKEKIQTLPDAIVLEKP